MVISHTTAGNFSNRGVQEYPCCSNIVSQSVSQICRLQTSPVVLINSNKTFDLLSRSVLVIEFREYSFFDRFIREIFSSWDFVSADRRI